MTNDCLTLDFLIAYSLGVQHRIFGCMSANLGQPIFDIIDYAATHKIAPTDG